MTMVEAEITHRIVFSLLVEGVGRSGRSAAGIPVYGVPSHDCCYQESESGEDKSRRQSSKSFAGPFPKIVF